MFSPTVRKKLYRNRYGIAISSAIALHIILLIVLTLHLRHKNITSGTVATIPINASLLQSPAAPTPPAATAPVKPTPIAPAKPTIKPAAVKNTPIAAKAEAIKSHNLDLHTESDSAVHSIAINPNKAKNTALKQIKQQALSEALAQETQQHQNIPKPILQKNFDQLAAEIAKEADSGKTLSPTTKASAAANNSTNTAEIDRYKLMILQQIQQNWIVPKQVEHLSCELVVNVAPGGMVLTVTVSHSSGNQALDRSAIAAIHKASPLPVPKKTADFEAFRSFTITVKPEGSQFEAA